MKPPRARMLLCLGRLAMLLAVLAAGSDNPASAEPQTQAGPYHVRLATEPAVIPAGRPVKMIVTIADAANNPVEDADVRAMVQMPNMAMGEHEETAVPVAGQPGMYSAPVQFAMQGDYTATIRIDGPQGAATGTIPLRTAQNTAGAAVAPGFPIVAWLPWIAVLFGVAFILYRMWRTGQNLSLRPLLNWRTWAGVGLLVVVYLISAWAVRTYTAPGHMSVLDAQAMDMSVMRPPVGAVPVAAMAAKREPIDATVRYTGSVVSYVDQDVTARVPGTILSMTAYPGQQVHRGQMLARLDTRELA